jgi:hypothetical protein
MSMAAGPTGGGAYREFSLERMLDVNNFLLTISFNMLAKSGLCFSPFATKAMATLLQDLGINLQKKLLKLLDIKDLNS